MVMCSLNVKNVNLTWCGIRKGTCVYHEHNAFCPVFLPRLNKHSPFRVTFAIYLERF